MSSPYRTCQSCGMPLKRDAQGGGTNADGSRSDRYLQSLFRGRSVHDPEYQRGGNAGASYREAEGDRFPAICRAVLDSWRTEA